MGQKDSFNRIKSKLDIKLRENHKIHKAVYKFKSLYSEADVIYDTKLNRIKIEAPLVTNLERILDIINNQRIYIPTKNEVNDPFEGEMIQFQYGIMGSWYHKAKKDLSPVAIAELERYRFLSLSAKANRPQMWGYYADTFRGLCLVYSTKKSFRNYEDILYLNENDRNDICKVLENPNEEERKLITRYNLLLKADDWIKEDEIRIITDSEQEFIEFDNDELIGIIIGHNMEEKNKNEIVNAARDNNIELYKTYLNNLKLKIDILPYDFNVEKMAKSGTDYECELLKWRNDDVNKCKYSLDIDGKMY